MKLTLVIDTDDIDGIRDTFKIAGHFYRKYAGMPYGPQLSYGKIKHIKMLRIFAKKAIAAHNDGVDPAGLRFTKDYAEDLFNNDPDYPGI
tara:strand:- start:212 stop:481 length:270 start_codon:yes stop_codon:yes gene_type:complete